MEGPTAYDWGDLSLLVEAGRRYAKAPIVEAIIELRFGDTETPDIKQLEYFLDASDGYEGAGPTVLMQGQVQLSEEGIVGSTIGEHVGFAFRKLDGSQIVQALKGRLGISTLPPYEGWDVALDGMLPIWRKYLSLAQGDKVIGAGVRFINRIEIPSRHAEIRDYLRTSVDVSPYLPQAISGLMMHVDIPLPKFEAMTRITSALVQPQQEGFTALLLDIDVQKDLDVALEGTVVPDALIGALNQMRNAKNFVFEACITDATRGLID